MKVTLTLVRKAPEDPMRAPTTVSSGWSRMKPSAHRAQPEYEFSSVMTTGMSAPPMEAVMCRPRAPLDTTPAVRERAARVGSPVRQNPASPATLVAPSPMLI